MDGHRQSNAWSLPMESPVVEQPYFQGRDLSVIPGSRDQPREASTITPIRSQPVSDPNIERRMTNARRESQVSAGTVSSSSSFADNSELMDELSGLGGYDVIRMVQQIDRDIKAGCGSGSTYHIVSRAGGTLFTAIEDDNCLCRWLCGPSRMSHITIYDLHDRPVLHLDRACCRNDCCCCCNCCMGQNSLIMRDARGNILGKIQQKCHIFQLRMNLLNAENKVVMQILGPCCPCRCCVEMNFDIMNHTCTKEIGFIQKKWESEDVADYGDVNTDHENIEISMPRYGSLEDKALVVGAAFLVNFMYMEMS